MREIFYPHSIAVIGVSEKPTNLGRNIIGNLVEYGSKPHVRIYLHRNDL